MFYTYYADTLITIMLGWIRAFTDWIWRLLSADGGSSGRSFLGWFSHNWVKLVVVMIAVGIIVDWLVWLVRWRPYWLWFGKKRRIVDDTEDAPAAQTASGEHAPAPQFTSHALPRHENTARPASQEELFEEDDLFDIVSPALAAKPVQTPKTRVGSSVDQYISGEKTRASAQQPKQEINWFDE